MSRPLTVNGKGSAIRKGMGALVVPADDEAGFASALKWLLINENERRAMGEAAYHLTIPYFTWKNIVKVFLDESGLDLGGKD